MTNEEAIEILEEVKLNNDGLSQYFKGFDEAFESAINSIEKQIAKKPIKDSKPFYRLGEPYYDWLCPICNRWLAYECDTQRTSIHHCPCGQALDWAEGDSHDE